MRRGKVISVNISPGGIPKRPTPRAEVATEGLVGDGHDHEKHNTPLQALSLIDLEDLEDLEREGFAVGPGATGENVTLEGLEVDSLQVGDRLEFSGGVTIELTKQRKPCYVLDAIDPELKKAIVGRCGFYGKILVPGALEPGETVRLNDQAS
jgi:MOSC domain-containing protein YiiM